MAPQTLRSATLGDLAQRGVPGPDYERTRLQPRIAHIGVGGFHRAHLALYTDELAAAGSDWGIVGLGLLAHDKKMFDALAAQDFLYTLTEKGTGEPVTRVIGSIIDYVLSVDDDRGLCAIVESPTTAIVSMTITEAGYVEPSAAQIAAGEGTTFDRLAAALAARRATSAGPLTILSCDNLPGNGAAARIATRNAAERFGADLLEWVDENCTFPNSMVDRITPMTSDVDRAWLRAEHGIDDRWPVVAEPFRQWVIEDAFAAGRPRWEDVGVLFTDRVHDWELYKLRLLNAGHSCMAYLCALADITFVDEAMALPAVRTFLEDLLFNEAVPTLTAIPGHPREDYVASVLERFANTGVRDQIARLCIDGSAKFPTFLLPTIAHQLELGGPIRRSTTALAAWARYLAVVPHDHQSHDTSMATARRYGEIALSNPTGFLDNESVFPEPLRSSERFRSAFVDAYRDLVERGPLAVMGDGGR